MKRIFFSLGFGCLFTHELDAMTNSEWRVIPLLRSLPDELGMTVFVIGHVPLLALIIAVLTSESEKTRIFSRLCLSGFLVVHGALHLLYSGDPNYEFTSNLSLGLIFGGAFFGAAHLLLSYRDIRSLMF